MNTGLYFCRRIAWLFLGIILLLVVALYGGFSGNLAVFDDHSIFSDLSVYDHAVGFFSNETRARVFTRAFPYFTIGFAHVLSGGDLAWNRYLSIALHGLVILALYFFLLRALVRIVAEATTRRNVTLIVCLWMALNPVAVYAAGYLIQRTIVMATLFGIVSVTLYLRAQQQEHDVDLLSAALVAFFSAMSKEHAVLLPLATIALTPLVVDWNRRSWLRAGAYFLLTLPGAVWVILHRGQAVLGRSYEVFSGQVLSQFARPDYLDSPLGLWLMSVITQLLLFWKYLFLWLVPNPAWMSADLRVDFPTLWASPLAYAGALLTFVLLAGAAIYWLFMRGRGRLEVLSAVLLFAAIPFVIELSVVRVQEPFVLYRSFLWMPAYALLFCLMLSWGYKRIARYGVVVSRAFWGVAVVAGLALFPLAQDRLRSLSSEEALWQDAMEKLIRPDVAGADRIYYNLAGEAYKRKDYAKALEWSEKVVVQNPRAFQGYLARGTSLLALGEVDAAEQAFNEAGKHHPPKAFLGYIQFKRCAVSDARGRHEETISCLRRSAKMGYEMAGFRLRMAGIPVEE